MTEQVPCIARNPLMTPVDQLERICPMITNQIERRFRNSYDEFERGEISSKTTWVLINTKTEWQTCANCSLFSKCERQELMTGFATNVISNVAKERFRKIRDRLKFEIAERHIFTKDDQSIEDLISEPFEKEAYELAQDNDESTMRGDLASAVQAEVQEPLSPALSKIRTLLSEELNEIEKDLYRLKYHAEFSNKEIAEVLKIEVSTVRKRLSRLNKKAKAILEKLAPDALRKLGKEEEE